MENRVLKASYKLRDGLEATEEAVATIQKELEVDERLVQGDMPYVEVRGVIRDDAGLANCPVMTCPGMGATLRFYPVHS